MLTIKQSLFEMFFCHKIPAIELLQNLTDCHTHILPGVDDGVQTIEESLQALSFYEAQGVRRVIFTPHIMEDLPLNNVDFLRGEFDKFQNTYDGNIELSLSAEYMLDNRFVKHLESGDLLTLFDNYLLVEMSYALEMINFTQIISNIMSSGYFVVLAHPERYQYLDYSIYRQLKNMGVLFQMNIPSLLGYYGKGVKNRALKLLNDGMYDMMGSDLHNLETFLKFLEESKLSKSEYNKILRIKNYI